MAPAPAAVPAPGASTQFNLSSTIQGTNVTLGDVMSPGEVQSLFGGLQEQVVERVDRALPPPASPAAPLARNASLSQRCSTDILNFARCAGICVLTCTEEQDREQALGFTVCVGLAQRCRGVTDRGRGGALLLHPSICSSGAGREAVCHPVSSSPAQTAHATYLTWLPSPAEAPATWTCSCPSPQLLAG